MSYAANHYVERRLTDDRQDRRSGFERRITATPLNSDLSQKGERQGDDRRREERRKHCLHCGMPYVLGPPGQQQGCVCRVTALRGSP